MDNSTIRKTSIASCTMRSSWEDVPDDLLYLLSQRLLGLATFVRFGAVCRYWHSFTLANNNCYKPVPWLLLSEKEGTDIRDFFDISTGEVYELPLPQTRGRKINASAHGWLMTAGKDSRFHLLNPLNGIQIELPPLQTFQDVPDFCIKDCREARDSFMLRATWSANPAACNGDFVVMAVHLDSHASSLSFCRSGDEKWTSFEAHCQDDVAFAGGQFYAMAGSGHVLSCDISNKSAPKHAEIASVPNSLGDWGYYIVDCKGELLVVERRRQFDHPHDLECTSYHTLGFNVYKLDLVGKKVVEIEDVGDYAIFVGYNDSICLPTTSKYLNKPFRRNCIYFTDDYDDVILPSIEAEGGEDMGVYSLEDKSIQPFYPGVSKSTFSFPIWFLPHSS